MAVNYQWEKALENAEPKEDISTFTPQFGPQVVSRNPDGTAKDVTFRLLVDNPDSYAYIVGDFNGWGKKLRKEHQLVHDEHGVFAEITIDEIKHGDAYKFRVSNLMLQDPAGVFFDDAGNSIFFDFDDPNAYQARTGFVDTLNRSTRVLQTDLPGLITHYAARNGTLGRDIDPKETYEFIASSGVLEEVKRLGFNAIQFLPFAQSIDGDNWKYRYLVPFPFAVNNRWGNPEGFARMVDAAHEQGIAIIADIVIGHMPNKDFTVFGSGAKDSGIHHWIGRSGQQVFMKEHTEWGTMRPDYDNQFVRSFLIESALHFMARYRIDGFRVDNVDGILRYGINGQGEERPSGRTFLRELSEAVYAYNPKALIHLESHYFKDDNSKMLVSPLEDDSRALGATAYTSSRLTYHFHTEYMPKDVKQVSVWRFKHITEEKEWGRSNSTVADFHNHDAAAGLMPLRCTGSYAYDAMTINPYNHIHAVGKIKVMEAIIAFCCEGRTLDLLQTFLLQTGTFEHDSSIHWDLTFNQANRGAVEYKRQVNLLMDDPAFWPQNVANRKFLNVDDKSKLLVVERSEEGGNRYIVIINLSAAKIYDYRVGVTTKSDYEVVFNSDYYEYAGFGMVSYQHILENRPSTAFEVLDREVMLDVVAPYGVVVLRETQ